MEQQMVECQYCLEVVPLASTRPVRVAGAVVGWVCKYYVLCLAKEEENKRGRLEP